MLSQLGEGIFVVGPDGPPCYPYSNCMYIEDERPAIIDMGAGERAFSAIDTGHIQVGLFSHFHFDHTHGDALFTGAELFVGWQEKEAYINERQYINLHGYNLWQEMMANITRPPFKVVVGLPDDVLAKPGFRPLELAGTFGDGDIIDLGRHQLQTVHLPGHTVGHYGFYLEKEGILFSGDMDLVPSGPWYSSASADVGALIRSVQRMKEIDPRVVVPSHRRVQTSNIQESMDRYIQVVFDRQNRIMESMAEAHSIEELYDFPLGFPTPTNMYELFWVKMSIRHHLSYLLKVGLIEEVEKGRYRRN